MANVCVVYDLDRTKGDGVIQFELRGGILNILILEKDTPLAEWAGGIGTVTSDVCEEIAHDLMLWLRRPVHYRIRHVPFTKDIRVHNYLDARRADTVSPIQASAGLVTNNDTIALKVETDRNAIGLAGLFHEMYHRIKGVRYAR